MPSMYGESFVLDKLLFIKRNLERKGNVLDSNFSHGRFTICRSI